MLYWIAILSVIFLDISQPTIDNVNTLIYFSVYSQTTQIAAVDNIPIINK